MKKIPTIFVRDFDGDPSRVLSQQNPDCAWVFDGKGIATRKFDGTCCMFDGQTWWKRREVKSGKADPEGFRLEDEDRKTGKRVGWMPVEAADKWHIEAIATMPDQPEPGTYELCGPKVQGNPEEFSGHVLVAHAVAEECDCPRDFDGLREWLSSCPFEGVVFHHPDGQMAKIKRRDFGYK